MDEKVCHFTVDGKWLTDFVRTRYHFENERDHAFSILRCLKGLSLDDAYAVINGEASLISCKDDPDIISLVLEPDEIFKEDLAKHIAWKIAQEKRDLECEQKAREDRILAELEEDKRVNEAIKTRKLREIANIKLAQFEEFAVMVYKECGTGSLFDAYYDKEMKDNMRDKFKPGSPHMIKWKEYVAGKDWIDASKQDPESDIEVIDFYTISVRKSVIDEYVNITLDRLRKVQRAELRRYPDQDFWMIDELESTRRALHGAILKEAGFDRYDSSPGATVFRAMVEIYIEEKAKTFGVLGDKR